ncbi:transposase [Siccirubricoccus deserti]|nr:transposase [Siccirubricoccus deserti]
MGRPRAAPAARQSLRPARRRTADRDPRARMDAMLYACVTGCPWHDLPETDARPLSIARQFRRLAHAGVWSGLLRALAAPGAPAMLRAMEYWICRLARRAMRLLGMAGIGLARGLGLLSALPMLPWFMPNRDLSQALHAFTNAVLDRLPEQRPRPGLLTLLGKCLQHAGGRPVWSKKLAPP